MRRNKKGQKAGGYVAGSGIIDHGKHKGEKLTEISEGALNGYHGHACLGGYHEAFTVDVKAEVERRKGLNPNVDSEFRTFFRDSIGAGEPRSGKNIGTSGVILWGHCVGQGISGQSDEALAGAIWAAERGVGDATYHEALQAERKRRDPGGC